MRTFQTPSLITPPVAICGTGAFRSIRFCALRSSQLGGDLRLHGSVIRKDLLFGSATRHQGRGNIGCCRKLQSGGSRIYSSPARSAQRFRVLRSLLYAKATVTRREKYGRERKHGAMFALCWHGRSVRDPNYENLRGGDALLGIVRGSEQPEMGRMKPK